MNENILIEKISLLINEVEKEIGSLGKSLRKSIDIYKKSDNKAFERFVTSELTGYENDQILPEYRTGFLTTPIGIYQNMITGAKDEISLDMDQVFIAAKMDPVEANVRSLPHSVFEMEHFIENTETPDLRIGFTNQQTAMFKKLSHETGGWVLIDGYFKFSISVFPKILSTVRTLLLQYLHQIKESLEEDSVTIKTAFFENGSPFDALITVSTILKKATKEIMIVDAYVDEKTLSLFTFKKPHIKIKMLTHPKSLNDGFEIFKESFNKQYQNLEIRTSKVFHDRFIIIDNKEFYHLGASLKDLGKSVFMFSRIADETILSTLKTKIGNEWN